MIAREVQAVPGAHVATAIYMDTSVTIEIVGAEQDEGEAAAARAFRWFEAVERSASRFDEQSELAALCRAPAGVPHQVSSMLYRQIEFAVAVAGASGGAFDPTVGRAMELAGYDRNYVTGHRIASTHARKQAGYRDIILDPRGCTVTLKRPLLLDLGAVAKGFAIDLAASELAAFPDFAINAGGDVFVRGCNRTGSAWRIGVRHPRRAAALIDTLSVTDAAVCTSGDYERPRSHGLAGHHIIQPAAGCSAEGAASVTVIAPTAMVADALSTAAFALGPERGIALLEEQGVQGIIVTPGLRTVTTAGIGEYRR